MTPPIILTRYLYIKEEVLVSLVAAILAKDRDQSLFWTYELYFSGFETEVLEYVFSIYNEFFSAENPRLRKFLQKMYDNYDQGPHIIGTMVLNLIDPTRKSRQLGDYTKIPQNMVLPNPTPKDHRFYVLLNETDIIQYKTIELENGMQSRHILSRACKYKTRNDLITQFDCRHACIPSVEVVALQCNNWEYYASFSPIWLQRITQYGGFINHETNTIIFDNEEDDEDEQTFYHYYGYEPDEQPVEVSSKFMAM